MGNRARLAGITAAAALASGGLVFGSGLLGARVQAGFGGVFRAQATLLSPARAAFLIWSLVYLGLFAFVGWLWFADDGERPRVDAILAPAAWALGLNGAWLVVMQFADNNLAALWGGVVIAIGIEVSLALVLVRLSAAEATDRLELVVVDGTFGLYLGWTTIAVAANIAAAGHASGLHPAPMSAAVIAAAALLVLALVGVLFARNLGGRWSIGVAMAWGLGWIAIGRLYGEPASAVVGVAAGLAGVLVVGATAVARLRAARR
ncbi:hypothetical protein [Propionicimonas sp.]|uniref:hypothetical protein n=1 Tax=Propionicimonas sp. TaxID=1955623 RepID=UPI0017DFF23B|nr:hypothetical protein [Propionicimonas sp.]MBU3976710.1 tryptophan-rich sensory protein [Actinomycetota bacterium]MBA3019775.1 tryptophan-rich sensory protein [Propionicimonas sp.]MBU3986805.1 tryptophan-rich sensory protein [Actinomycetota bacterium]MBU4006717.1 tryptophan-rich sensory protein [Actinomycetota bacterium]MBU4065417.1 tryptophan-rich sensory protein [Actinomycetota bacterium]